MSKSWKKIAKGALGMLVAMSMLLPPNRTVQAEEFEPVSEQGAQGELQESAPLGQADLAAEGDVVEISSESGLQALLEQGKTEAITGAYVVTRDFRMSSQEWEGIQGFKGIFDGNGHTITGLKSNMGLFRNVAKGGIVKNLTVGGTISCKEGDAGGGILCGLNEGQIENCHTMGMVEGLKNCGGLVGINDGTVSQCSSQAAVKGKEGRGEQMGGLAGSGPGDFLDCYAAGSVSGIESVGGLIGGKRNASSTGNVISCYATGDVSGINKVGGLIGEAFISSGAVQYCHATGNVSGDGSVGGFLGESISAKVQCCYAAGTVTGASNAGGFIGAGAADMSYCYARGLTNGGEGGGFTGNINYPMFSYYNAANTGNRAGHAQTAAELRMQETYYGWDFEHVWAMGEDGYPCIRLRGEAGPVEISGSGSEEDPYILENEMQLFAMAGARLPINEGKFYRLGNDIELTSQDWEPISFYSGVIDGAGHKIYGLKTGNSGNTVGLFGANSGTIKNLHVSGEIGERDAELAPRGILCGYNSGWIENCHVTGRAGGGDSTGGLVGNNDGTIFGCSAQVEMQGDGQRKGGLVGWNDGSILHSHASGTVSGAGGFYGGLAGSSDGSIEYSYASGTVSGQDKHIGGLVGYGSGIIRYSHASGDVSGASGVGGLMGSGYGNTINQYQCSYASGNVNGSGEYVGGLIGYYDAEDAMGRTVVRDCYARGIVNGGDGYGLMGRYVSDIQVENCYLNSLNAWNEMGTRISSESMKKKENFHSWDFQNVWAMGADGYPCIKNYRLSASAGEGGEIVPSGDMEAFSGAKQPFHIHTEEGYQIRDIKVDGVSIGASVSNYVFDQIRESHTIEVSFQKNGEAGEVKVERISLNQTEVTLGVGEAFALEASVSPENASNQRLTWISSDEEVASVADGLVTAHGDGIATIMARSQDGSNVTASCLISVQKGVSGDCTIYASVGKGGSIQPSGEVAVPRGGRQAFAITAEPGYRIQHVAVDGVDIGAQSSYLFTKVTEDHTITAMFQKEEGIAKEQQTIQGTASYQKTFGDAPFRLDTVLEKGDGKLSYRSQSPQVASVSSNGTVTIKGAGAAKVIVTAEETAGYEKAEYLVVIQVAKSTQKISGAASYTKTAGSKPFALNARRTAGDGSLSYLSSNPAVADVAKDGKVSIGKEGEAVIIITASETQNCHAAVFRVTVKVKAKAPAKGTVLTDPKTKAKYKVARQGKELEYQKPKDKSVTSASVPAAITISGIKYSVTGIASNAFSGCGKLKSVSIGKNVASIGAKAFYKCKKLTKLTIPAKVSAIGKQAFSGCGNIKAITLQTAKLMAKSVGAKAFQGIHAKALVKVPKKKKAAYQKLLHAKGLGKKAKIK